MASFATFNVNNLFVRYKFQDKYQGQMKKVSELSAKDEKAFGFLPANKVGKTATNYRVFNAATRKVAADILKSKTDGLPDILCLQEVENLTAARLFNAQNLGGHYDNLLLLDSWDPRGIDVAVLSVHPIVDVVSHVDDVVAGGGAEKLFSRDCLEATIAVPKLGDVTFFVNHLKSKFVNRTKGMTDQDFKDEKLRGNERRLMQAKKVKQLAASRFAADPNALWVVIGDMNDTPASPWIKPFRANGFATDIIATHFPVAEQWTHYFAGQSKVAHLDHVLVSPAMAARVAAAAGKGKAPHIERSGIGYRSRSKTDATLTLPQNVHHEFIEDDGVTPIPKNAPKTVSVDFRFPRHPDVAKDPNNRASDHCPVTVWF